MPKNAVKFVIQKGSCMHMVFISEHLLFAEIEHGSPNVY